ncbi:MAG: SxtJ family membrane protein [Desulfovibrio sp.]|jgi:hypothetical protein|nr:SxtJ family membrane protein [Desulfovibrio sp.]
MRNTDIGPVQQRDTALALIFLLQLIWFFTGETFLLYVLMAFTLFAMLFPKLLTVPARLWFGLAYHMSLVSSRIIFGLIYIVPVLPVALVRRVLGKDSLRLKAYGKGQGSAFIVREHRYTAQDLENLF